MIPEPINYRQDGSLTLIAHCGCEGGPMASLLVIDKGKRGHLGLSFHGTNEHTIWLSRAQVVALCEALAGADKQDQA